MITNEVGEPGDSSEAELRESEVRAARIGTLVGLHDLMIQSQNWVAVNTALDSKKVAGAVEEYLVEWRTLKTHDKISGKIKWHKIAGLMTAAIVTNCPLQEVVRGEDEGLYMQGDSWKNAHFAVIHGLSVCAEGHSKEKMSKLLSDPHFLRWREDFVLLLRSGPPCKQSLIHIYETLCLGFFPENLDQTEDEDHPDRDLHH